MQKKTAIPIVKDSAEIQEGYIPATGGEVWYKIAGKNQTGIPLLIVHGGPGVSHDYLEPLGVLSDERPVIFYEQLSAAKSRLYREIETSNQRGLSVFAGATPDNSGDSAGINVKGGDTLFVQQFKKVGGKPTGDRSLLVISSATVS